MSLLVIAGMLLYALYVAYPIVRAREIDRTLIPVSKPFSLNDSTRAKNILVLGDSTAVGVGASPEESVAGRLATYLHASVDNFAKSGAVSGDVAPQAALAQKSHYDLIVIQVGANDVIGFRSLNAAAESLDSALTGLQEKSSHIVVLTSGDIGKAQIFRWPLNAIYSKRTRDLRELFMQVTAKHDAVYVDIYSKPDLVSADPERMHSPDGLHLSGAGYEYWFTLVSDAISQWKDLRG